MVEVVTTDRPTSKSFVDHSGEVLSNGIEIISYAGQDKFGMAVYECECPHCGMLFTTRWNSLQSGNVVGCGCRIGGVSKDDQYHQMIGQKFGRLTITGYERIEKERKSGKSRAYFHCDCDCGTRDILVRADRLIGGISKSCGCLHRDRVSETMKNIDRSTFKKAERVYERKTEVDPEILSHIGEKYNRLTIIGAERKESGGRLRNFYHCRCDCGNEIDARTDAILRGSTKSCGCLKLDVAREVCIERNTKHGLTHSRLYTTWSAMKDRCYNTNNNRYNIYGGRGIKICDEWLDKENGFMNFYNWAMENGYEDTLTIDRIDNNGNYCPDNCRWVDMNTQSRNKGNNFYIGYEQNFDLIGKPPVRYVFTITDWSNIINVNVSALRFRLIHFRKNWTVERALTTRVDGTIAPIIIPQEVLQYNRLDMWDKSIHD